MSEKIPKGAVELKYDVLEASIERIKDVLLTFDSHVVMFSGGKDSMVTLDLVDKIRKEMGFKDKTKVVFRDEEVIPDDVIDFVLRLAKSGKYDFYYYAIPMKSELYFMGNKETYIQWDVKRKGKYVREKPDIARLNDDLVLDQYNADDYIADDIGLKGKIAYITGIRTDESLVRLQSVMVNKRNPYIANIPTSKKSIKLIKPIYDWSEKDIFKYFHDEKVPYCTVYDNQVWNDMRLRVATPLHAEASKQFDKVKSIYPRYYGQIVQIFPQFVAQGLYYNQMARKKVVDDLPVGEEGLYKYIRENITDPKQRKQATEKIMSALKTRRNKMAEGQTDNYGGYPMRHLAVCLVNGQYKRNILPKSKPTQADIEYEEMLKLKDKKNG